MATARNVYKVWFTTDNGKFVIVASDPPGKTAESEPAATHAITISFAEAVAIKGKFDLQEPNGPRKDKTIKVKLKKDEDGNLKVLGSDPPGKTDKSSATHALIISFQAEPVPTDFKFRIERF